MLNKVGFYQVSLPEPALHHSRARVIGGEPAMFVYRTGFNVHSASCDCRCVDHVLILAANKQRLRNEQSPSFTNLAVTPVAQIMKLMNIPFVCAVERFWLGKHFSTPVIASVVVVVVGVGIV